MSSEAMKWIWWGVATFGIAGMIAIAVFAPAVFSIITRVVGAFLKLLLGYRIGCAALAAVLMFFWADYHRAKLDEADWAKRVAAFEQKQQARDALIAEDARAQVRAELDQEKQTSIDTEKQKDDFDVNLKPLPETDSVCRVGGDLDKLRQIAGAGVVERQADKRVPKIRWHRPTAGH